MGGNKIVIVGSTGSGKSTFAKRLSEIKKIKHYEIDSLFWRPDWVKTPNDEFRRLMDEVTANQSWIVDGNYKVIQDLTIGRADTVIWLDYSFTRTLKQLTNRTVRRLIDKTPLWHNNRESLRLTFSKDSIILYMVTQFKRKRRWCESLMASEELKHIEWHQIKNRKQENDFWESVK